MGHVLEPLLHDLAERFRFLEEELGGMTVLQKRRPPELGFIRSPPERRRAWTRF